MLDTATARVTELEGMLAAAPPQADVDAVQAMLDDANADVTRLTDERDMPTAIRWESKACWTRLPPG